MPSRSYRDARNAAQARPRDTDALTASLGAGAGTGSTAYQRPSIGMSRSAPHSYDPDADYDEDDDPEPYHPMTPSDYTDEDDGDDGDDLRDTPKPAKPRSQSYFDDLAVPSQVTTDPVEPKSKLLVCDLDNTLFGPSGDGVVARPYLKTFLRYVMHPKSPYSLAIWTFSGRMYGIAHLRQVGMGSLLFDSDDKLAPRKKPGLLAVWGYEDSGFLPNGTMPGGAAVKDLSLMWEMLNIANGSDWSPFDSLLLDDQRTNGRAQPDSIVNCPVFTKRCYDDDFLLACIGILDELSHESNFADAIRRRKLYKGGRPSDLFDYVTDGKAVCKRLHIKVSRGTPYSDPVVMASLAKGVGPKPVGPRHDAAPEPIHPAPVATPQAALLPIPKRVADGMPLAPTQDYLADVASPKSGTASLSAPKLVVFDLDGTLYCRPPQHLEHIPAGEPAGRPYLRSMLTWLLQPSSPWTVAIWTGSQKKTAVECLYELDLGLVGPKLVGAHEDQAELLHPKLVALWAREDFDLTPKDYVSYVAVVKDLSRLWRYLNNTLHLGPFDAHNTVMVDDTPTKLRAQPYSLIAAPTFDYPLAPSVSTVRAQVDSFLLTLVGFLFQLETESNMANYIKSHKWYEVMNVNERVEWRVKGLQLLNQDGILVAAEGRGLLPGISPSVNDPGYRTAKSIPATPLTRSALESVAPALAAGVSSDTDRSDTTSGSVDGEQDDSEEEANKPAANTTESPKYTQFRRDRARSWRDTLGSVKS
ncbi:hypothetical protein RHOSPDRAFT_34699 [Rhodotorula sp. JG-1b]|nr:hypothetical protein RHOSPDRAFT_34699 [Rhodotorula sp. JG-1b]